MKFSYLLLAAITSFSCLGQNNPFQGTWQLTSGEYLDDTNKTITYESLGISSQKVLSAQHFSFVSMSKGKFWSAGTGSYTYDSTKYHETPKYASYPLEDGGTYTFEYELKGDSWHNSRYRNGKRVEFEIWQRVK
jgi:hypothetical protein